MPPTDSRRAFGAALREAREEAGLSQDALAGLADLHRTYVGGIERGERNPSLENIVRLAESLGTTVAILFKAADL